MANYGVRKEAADKLSARGPMLLFGPRSHRGYLGNLSLDRRRRCRFADSIHV